MDDRVSLSGLRLEGRHGVDPKEHRRSQAFEVAIACPTDAGRAARGDDIAATVDYRRLREIAAAVIEGPPRALIETLAETIAQRVLAECGVAWVRVRVTKLAPPGIGAPASVEIERRRPTRRARTTRRARR